jgi:Carboxypeptidase regulatory-like domain
MAAQQAKLFPKKIETPEHDAKNVSLYAIISLISFLCGAGLLAVMVWKADRLVALGLTGNLYYVVLLPLALAAAAFLFGVLRSYAHYRGEQLGGVLELGGPVVAFGLVVIGGFFLVPNVTPFSLTIYVHGENGPHDLVLRNSGFVFLDLGPDRRREPIGDKGQAYFAGIPANFRGQDVAASVESDAFEQIAPQQKHRLDGTSLDLAVRRKSAHISGRVQDEQGNPISEAKLTVAGLSAITDAAGHFEFSIPGERLKSELDLHVAAAGFASKNLKVVTGANDLVVTLMPP